MAPPLRPGRGRPTGLNASSSPLDSELWRSYITQLKNLALVEKKLDSQTEALFAAPIGLLVVPAGTNVPVEITNNELFRIADTLLSPTYPVFLPGVGSYLERQSRHLDAIRLKGNPNPGTMLRLQVAQKKQADLQAKFEELEVKAREAFNADEVRPENMPFRDWVSRCYPNFDSLASELRSAIAAAASALIVAYGPGAAELNQQDECMRKAMTTQESYQGFNMPVAEQRANLTEPTLLNKRLAPSYRPLYTMDNYREASQGWITNRATAAKTTIAISAALSSSEPWADLGHSNTPPTTTGPYSLIFARTGPNTTILTSEDLGPSLKISVSTDGLRSFTVKPGAWDINITQLFSDATLLRNFKLPASCAATQIIVGSNVTLTVSMDDAAAKKVNDLHTKTVSAGGSFSVFGVPIGVAPSAENPNATTYVIDNKEVGFSRFTVRGEGVPYTAVVGVVARKLPALSS